MKEKSFDKYKQPSDYKNSTIPKSYNFYNNTSIIYYIADLPVTRLRLLTNKSDNIAVPYASLRSLILLLSSFELRLFFPTHEKHAYIIPHLRERKIVKQW